MIDVARAVVELQGMLDEPARPGEPPCVFIWRLQNGELVHCHSRREWLADVPGWGQKELCETHMEFAEDEGWATRMAPITRSKSVPGFWRWLRSLV